MNWSCLWSLRRNRSRLIVIRHANFSFWPARKLRLNGSTTCDAAVLSSKYSRQMTISRSAVLCIWRSMKFCSRDTKKSRRSVPSLVGLPVPGPTQTLPWYDAYNKTKHDSKEHFPAANVLACLQAMAANIVMFSVRFGPFRLYQGGGMLSALFNPTFVIALRDCDPKSFYVPKLDVAGRNQNLTWGQAETLPRKPIPFVLPNP
jgi:hypothetical protein